MCYHNCNTFPNDLSNLWVLVDVRAEDSEEEGTSSSSVVVPLRAQMVPLLALDVLVDAR